MYLNIGTGKHIVIIHPAELNGLLVDWVSGEYEDRPISKGILMSLFFVCALG